MVQERARIHKQLRLIFIYPLVYILMWMIPFVSHCMNYSDKWAANPLYGLSVTSTICITLMGFVDSLIFSLRERPWRHMPTSDGSFFGSFVVFRRMSASSQGGLRRPTDSLQRLHTETNPETPNMAGVSRGLGSNVFSSSFPNLLAGRSNRVRRRSDQKTAAEMARVRLEFEKQDRRQTLEKDRERGSVPGSITVLQTIDSPQEEESERESHNERESHDEKESQDEKKSAAMEQSWPSSS
jgi:G protein-coupled receptor GPR1